MSEKRSSNKRGPNGNRWLYPDVVGMEDLGAEWHQEVRDCVNQYSDKRTKLWSFEAKLLINRSNSNASSIGHAHQWHRNPVDLSSVCS